MLELLLHAVFIALETLELLVDTFLESIIGLTLYEAQAVTAWLGFGTFLLLLVFGLKRLNILMQRLKAQVPAWWEEEKAQLRLMRKTYGWSLGLGLVLVLVIVALIL